MSNKPENLILITDDGVRLDGRGVDEIRPMKIEIGVLSRADGSCYLEWGRNKILVGVFGPREAHPRRMQRADTAVIRYKYNMASFSVEDRARPGPSRRSIEISKVSREAFEPVIMAELFPKTAIDIFVEVLQADAGTRTAAINASSIALADAGIPMKGLITSCAFGKVDGQIVLDLNKEEDNYGEADFPVAMTQDGEITLMQMDGHLTPEEIKRGFELVKKGCKEILELQQAALRKRFETHVEEPEEEIASSEDTEDKVTETEEPSLKYASEAAIVEEAIEKIEEHEKTALDEGCICEEIPDSEEAEEITMEGTQKGEEDIPEEEEPLEEVTESEIEEEALEDEADFEASFEASYEEVEELDELEDEAEEIVPEEKEEVKTDFEKPIEDEIQPEESEVQEAASEETFESAPEAEAEFTTEVLAEGTVEVEEEPEEAKEETSSKGKRSKGPWKVVKDPSESGSKGENDE